MAKLSAVNKNNRRIKLSNKFYLKRKKLTIYSIFCGNFQNLIRIEVCPQK